MVGVHTIDVGPLGCSMRWPDHDFGACGRKTEKVLTSRTVSASPCALTMLNSELLLVTNLIIRSFHLATKGVLFQIGYVDWISRETLE
jgi:hypothetical protein